MSRTITIFIISILVSGGVVGGVRDSFETTTDPQKLSWMMKGKDAVKARLKDSDSAKFRNVYFNLGSGGIPVTCGEVNSKNSFGGYTGYQKFISAGSPELTYLQEQVSDFQNAWNQLCR